MPKAPGGASTPRGLAENASRHAGCSFPAGDGAVGREEIRFRRRRLRARAGRFDHRRSLPGAGSHARAQRGGRPRIPRVGDVRKPAAEGQVQDLRGRGRHRGDVLHLQVAEEQSHPQSGRHDCARHADFHAVPRDGAPRGLRPPLRRGRRQAGEPLPVSGRGAQEAPRSEGQGVLRRQSGQPVRGCAFTGYDQEDRSHSQEAAGSDPADRRCLRHVRAGLPFADGRVSRRTRSASIRTASTSAAPAGASARSRCTKTTSSTR